MCSDFQTSLYCYRPTQSVQEETTSRCDLMKITYGPLTDYTGNNVCFHIRCFIYDIYLRPLGANLRVHLIVQRDCYVTAVLIAGEVKFAHPSHRVHFSK